MDDLRIKISDKFFVKLAEKKSKNQENGKKSNNKKLICYCLSAVASRVFFPTVRASDT